MVTGGGISFSGGFSIFFDEEVDNNKLENGIEIEKISNIMPNIQSAPRNPITNYHNVHRYGRFGWSRGSILNFCIGQGELLVTPIQVFNYLNFENSLRP